MSFVVQKESSRREGRRAWTGGRLGWRVCVQFNTFKVDGYSYAQPALRPHIRTNALGDGAGRAKIRARLVLGRVGDRVGHGSS